MKYVQLSICITPIHFQYNHFETKKIDAHHGKPVPKDIKELILEMKQESRLWGCHRIADELKKLGVELNPTTVNRIIQTFRKQGKIQPNGSWKKFLKSHYNYFRSSS